MTAKTARTTAKPAEPGGRNWKMDGTAMVPADERPDVRPPGEDRPVGGGPHGHDFATSMDDGPPIPASDQVAAASRPRLPTGTTN